MMERARILLVAAPDAPIFRLADRLQDPDIDIRAAADAKAGLVTAAASAPDIVVVDSSLSGAEIFRFYGRFRGSAFGLGVPIVFTNHTGAQAGGDASAGDFYLGPDATLDDVEQVIFSFLPESLTEEIPPRSEESSPPPQRRWTVPPLNDAWAQVTTGPAPYVLLYVGAYLVAEVVAAGLDARLGFLLQLLLLAALAFHGASAPTGVERSLYWGLVPAPLNRIYALSMPYADVPPIWWWALTALPIVVGAAVAARLASFSRREIGLAPTVRELPIAAFMVPVGVALGVIEYLLISSPVPGSGQRLDPPWLMALILIVNPGIVQELALRGVVQRAAMSGIGTGLGLLVVATLSAPPSPAGVVSGLAPGVSVFSAAVGLLLAFLTWKTGSILSSVVTHASLALSLFMIAPFLVPVAPPATRPGPAGEVQAPAATRSSGVASPGPVATAVRGSAGSPAPAASGSPSPIVLLPPSVIPTGAASPSPPQPEAAQPVQPPASGSGSQSQVVVVRGTGGAGARLRAQPGSAGATLDVIAEYTPLVVVGPDQTVDGVVWRHVRAPTGAEGWISSSFLTTGRDTTPASATSSAR
ncbi:MAG: CPBP family intramembrane metalloprotease [Chloroflexi bacterium]|nr:CPBP family intramembrane metalloprotease [Chloroflexota bacterium]